MQRTSFSLAVGLSALLTACFVPTRSVPDASRLASMRVDVERMELDSNVERRQVLETILTEGGVDFVRQSFSIPPRQNYPRTEGTNLVVTLGSGDTDIVVGAHYDAAWLGDGTLSRGAVDNAASAVILTRVAETLERERLQARLHVVFFDMEEIGLVGSREFVQSHDHPIAAAINLDVNGYGDTVFFGPTGAAGNDTLHRFVLESCLAERIDCEGFPMYPSSDYISFQRAGVRNVSLSVLPRVETRQFWLFLNSETRGVFEDGFLPRVFETIHTRSDTSDLVEPLAMELSYRVVLALIRRVDSAL